MRLTFKVRYHTNLGQSLLLIGDHEIFGNGDIAKAIPLHYVDEQFWEATFFIPGTAIPDATITYNYVLRNQLELCGRIRTRLLYGTLSECFARKCSRGEQTVEREISGARGPGNFGLYAHFQSQNSIACAESNSVHSRKRFHVKELEHDAARSAAANCK
jgi:hypothetical protein